MTLFARLRISRNIEENQVKETIERIDEILRRLETLKEGL